MFFLAENKDFDYNNDDNDMVVYYDVMLNFLFHRIWGILVPRSDKIA